MGPPVKPEGDGGKKDEHRGHRHHFFRLIQSDAGFICFSAALNW